jgi:hypothetical protein
MKKLLSIFSIVALTLILVFPADASIDARERPNGASFHIKNVVDYAQAYGIRGNDNVTRIPVCLEIRDKSILSLKSANFTLQAVLFSITLPIKSS